MNKKLLALSLLLAFAVVPFSGCTQQGTGELVLQITDAPGDLNITACIINVSQVYVHQSGGDDNETNETGEWILVVNESQMFDLIDIQNVTEFFASTNLSVGKYTQIRLVVDDCHLVVNGTEVNCTVPSGTIKLNHPFSIVDNETTTLTLDFDVYESVHENGTGQYIFRPTIRVIAE